MLYFYLTLSVFASTLTLLSLMPERHQPCPGPALDLSVVLRRIPIGVPIGGGIWMKCFTGWAILLFSGRVA
jgi:hypothetical protein